MDALHQTPFLDFFRRGEVPPDVRMLAAKGALAPRAHEQLALLVLLTSDADPAIRDTANRTIDRIPRDALSSFLARSDVDQGLRTFFEKRGVGSSAVPAVDREEPLITVEEDAGSAAAAESAQPGPDKATGPAASPAAGEPAHPMSEDEIEAAKIAAARERIPTVQRLSLLNVTDKIKAAMRGSREERMVLIRDPNKLVSLAVLSSSKLTEQEVEGFARLAAVSEDVLRVIGTSRTWIKNYGIMAGLTFNPKTPIGISMNFVNRLTDKDVRMLSTDRNVPEPLRILARKMISAGQARKH